MGARAMRARWRQWRIRVWSARLHAREIHLAVFEENPYASWGNTENMSCATLRSRVAKAKYKVALLSACRDLPPMRVVARPKQ